MPHLALNAQIRGRHRRRAAVPDGGDGGGARVGGEGQPVGDVRGGAIIVGVRDADGQFAPQPAAETILRSGDVVLAMGTERTMERLEDLFAPAGTQARS
jgi:hypothetical protein